MPTRKQKEAAARKAAQYFGAQGGAARAAKLSDAQLSEIGQKGAAKRWEGHTPKRPKKKVG